MSGCWIARQADLLRICVEPGGFARVPGVPPHTLTSASVTRANQQNNSRKQRSKKFLPQMNADAAEPS
jgi:hypothetical protein